MVPDKNNCWTPNSFKFFIFLHQIHLYIFTSNSFHRLNPIIEESPITPYPLHWWRESKLFLCTILFSNVALFFSFPFVNLVPLFLFFFCWFGLQKTCEMNIINTIISLMSDARARPPLYTFFLFSESSSSLSSHIYFTFPLFFSLPFFITKKHGFEKPKVKKSEKKKRQMWWRRAHID